MEGGGGRRKGRMGGISPISKDNFVLSLSLSHSLLILKHELFKVQLTSQPPLPRGEEEEGYRILYYFFLPSSSLFFLIFPYFDGGGPPLGFPSNVSVKIFRQNLSKKRNIPPHTPLKTRGPYFLCQQWLLGLHYKAGRRPVYYHRHHRG